MKKYFTSELFDFLEELERNNNKAWFAANRTRYEKLAKEPLLEFIADFAPKLKAINQHFVADPKPSGGSMFRIYRDTRFSRDKTPYKTWIAAHFDHEASNNDVHSPGFYLHLETSNSMGGGGLWHPESEALAAVRNYIIDNPETWQKVKDTGLVIEGDRLVRPPQGFDPTNEFIEDLKFKDFYTTFTISEKQAISAHFLEIYTKICQKTAPLTEFLTKAVGLPW